MRRRRAQALVPEEESKIVFSADLVLDTWLELSV
jgi:hypothetical protein